MVRIVGRVFVVAVLPLVGVAVAQPPTTFNNAVISLFDHFMAESRAVLAECPPQIVEAYWDQWRRCAFVGDDTHSSRTTADYVKVQIEYAILLDGDRFDEPPPYDYWLDRGHYETRILEFIRTGDYVLLGIYDGMAGGTLGSVVAFAWE